METRIPDGGQIEHTPCMVARGLLPMRAWFIPVLTPIIVFLKCGWTTHSHKRKHTQTFTHEGRRFAGQIMSDKETQREQNNLMRNISLKDILFTCP